MIGKILKYLSEKQLSLQSIILWVLAMSNLISGNNAYFWMFAIPAIIIGGMQDILEELRKLNNKEHES
jgi:hypothetical protein